MHAWSNKICRLLTSLTKLSEVNEGLVLLADDKGLYVSCYLLAKLPPLMTLQASGAPVVSYLFFVTLLSVWILLYES